MKITFKTPYEYDGKTYESLEVPIEDLNGSQLHKLLRDYATTKDSAQEKLQASNIVMAISGDDKFAAFIATSLAKQPLAFAEQLPAPDYIALTLQISSFLLA